MPRDEILHKGETMDSDILDRLEAEINADYEKKLNAIQILRGVGMGGGPVKGRRGRRPTPGIVNPPTVDHTAAAQLDQQEEGRRKPPRGADKESAFDKRLKREVAMKVAKERARKKSPLTDDERKKKQAAYARAWYARKKAGKDGAGLSKEKFEKYVHRGPISEGGNGDE
jgi:hypothetical protein